MRSRLSRPAIMGGAALAAGFFSRPREDVDTHLRTVLQCYGYDREQRVGIMRLARLHRCDLDGPFPDSHAAHEQLIEQTQRHLLRAGRERWSPETRSYQQCMQGNAELFQAACQIGLVDGAPASQKVLKTPHYAIIPGALMPRVKQRFEIMCAAKGNVMGVMGVSGERTAQPAEQEAGYNDEASMVKGVLSQEIQAHHLQIPLQVTQAKKVSGAARANTFDTKAGLKDILGKSDITHAVVYVESPFKRVADTLVQDTYKNELGQRVVLDTHVAPAEDRQQAALCAADEMARTFYGRQGLITSLLAEQAFEAEVQYHNSPGGWDVQGG